MDKILYTPIPGFDYNKDLGDPGKEPRDHCNRDQDRGTGERGKSSHGHPQHRGSCRDRN